MTKRRLKKINICFGLFWRRFAVTFRMCGTKGIASKLHILKSTVVPVDEFEDWLKIECLEVAVLEWHRMRQDEYC